MFALCSPMICCGLSVPLTDPFHRQRGDDHERLTRCGPNPLVSDYTTFKLILHTHHVIRLSGEFSHGGFQFPTLLLFSDCEQC